MDAKSLQDLIKETKKLKVLYVEDDENTRPQAIKIFTNFFDTIEVAVNGENALEMYKKNPTGYHLIISDINMPKMDGLEMSKAIFKINYQQKILIVSAYNSSEQLQEAIDSGISNYIHKPVRMDALITELQKIISSIVRENEEYEELNAIQNLNHELDAMINSFDTYVITSRTDLNGFITYVSKAFETISGYSLSELVGKPHNIIRHPDMPSSVFKEMWETIKSGKLWVGDIKNLRRDGSFYWVNASIAPYYDKYGEHIGYSAIRIDVTAQKELEKLHAEVNNLLNNAGQGFLSFNKNMEISNTFSKECLNIFEIKEIAKKNIADVLFPNDADKRELLIDGILRVVEADEDMIKDMLLSLLPTEHILNNKNIGIEYKVLENDMFMLILTDITKTKLLEQNLKEQNQIQKMILAVASNQNDFIELKIDFDNFIANPSSDLTTLLRELHTFKGIFSQKEMLYIPQAIHELETKIHNSLEKQNAIQLLKEHNLTNILEKDLAIITSALGKEFLNVSAYLSINRDALDALEFKIKMLESKETHAKLLEIFHDFEEIRYETVYDMLKIYQVAIKQIARKLEKEVYPLEIVGDRTLVASPHFKPFMKSLLHLFNNCVDHGIEDMDTRIENGKDEIGTILCKFSREDDDLQIIISDDGAGINIEKLIKNAQKKGISIDTDPIMLVFADNLSTKEELSTTSGRGVGMSAIKSEVNKLGGKIKIENNVGIGACFVFTLPLYR